jgi:hypothetical protein
MFDLHDWSLQSIAYEWDKSEAVILFKGNALLNALVAKDVCDLQIPHKRHWGPSVSVNRVDGPLELPNGQQKLTIEMQSGDVISVVAAEFSMRPA